MRVFRHFTDKEAGLYLSLCFSCICVSVASRLVYISIAFSCTCIRLLFLFSDLVVLMLSFTYVVNCCNLLRSGMPSLCVHDFLFGVIMSFIFLEDQIQ